MALRRYALAFSYNGVRYNGVPPQLEPANQSFTSLHNHLSLALHEFSPNFENLIISSRTDSGVSALRNTLHVDLPPRPSSTAFPSPMSVLNGLNYHLHFSSPLSPTPTVPNMSPVTPLRITECAPAPTPSWSARHSAFQRVYTYRILAPSAPIRPLAPAPFLSTRYLDVAKMHAAAQYLIGTHDFSSFRGAKCRQASPIKTVYDISVTAERHLDFFEPPGDSLYRRSPRGFCTEEGFGGELGGDDVITVRVAAPAFLYRQVRNIVGCLVEVGLGKRPASWVLSVLALQSRSAAGYQMAPPEALTLVDVKHHGFDEFDEELYERKPKWVA